MIVFIIFFVAVLCFGFVLIHGAPYLPTQKRQAEAALDLLGLKKGQVLYELGCGDGRMLRRAAERGLSGVGYELNPLLVVVARLATWRYRKRIRIVWGNFWKADLNPADGVYVFLLERFMNQLDTKLTEKTDKSFPVVSYAFRIPGRKAVRQDSGMYLYKY